VVDQAIIALRAAVIEATRLSNEAYSLMDGVERMHFTDVISHRGVANAIGYHQLARSLGMYGVASYAMHHLSYADYINRLCGTGAASLPEPAPVPADTNRYMNEAEILDQPRKVN
jgi:hypothetical protein